ncbi:MAPEG family protein [Polycladidibacter hongkongensis]|uniref:MAPEG family protein n=1 Tax=Polycladidibacter hongkongensis TaxID=1647556 RepID=UPI00082C9B02|nr:MAPEG family protein [Pseudovibrio hongkongensis]
MSFAIWSLLIAALLPLVAIGPAKLNRSYNNAYPRDPEYWRKGFRARAQGAHQNSYEAFPFYAVAVLVALWQQGDPYWINQLCGLYIAMRLIYIFCYWTNRPSLRSTSWAVGLIAALAIFTSPVWS